jgi:hypothetical protein
MFPQLGAVLGLLAILIMVGIQLSFLTVQIAQGAVYLVFMPMTPLALSWVVNHLYATPMGRVHVWVFQMYIGLFGKSRHSQSVRIDMKTVINDNENGSGGGSGGSGRGAEKDIRVGDVAIHSIACLMDNYCYLLVDNTGEAPHACCLVDTSECVNILAALSEIAVQQYGGKGYDKTNQLGDSAATLAESGATTNTKPPSQQQRRQQKQQSRRDGRRRELDGFSDVLRVEAVLSTHRHWDHTHGNFGMLMNIESCTR